MAMKHNHHYQGLVHSQVVKSREMYGENILTPPAKESLWSQFLGKFQDPIIVILLFALALSVGVAIYQYVMGLEGAHIFLEPAGILLAVVLATVVGFLFELSANRKFEILNKVSDEALVKVIRESNIFEITKREVVVGDILILNAGDEVPADCELMEAISLQVNESTLTGELVAKKGVDPAQFSSEATYPANHILRGTSVIEGHCVARVIAVGDSSEYGKVYKGAQIDNSVVTPLNRQLNRLASLITKVSYGVALLIIIGRLWAYLHVADGVEWISFGGYILNTIMIAVTIIVVAVPEGLPMSVTLSLALSMKRMLSTNNLVRKMHACETMGATTVICTDKTGTLTQNQMRLHEARFGGAEMASLGEDRLSRLVIESIAVNSTAHIDHSNSERIKVLGNPTEGALLLWLYGMGIDYLTIRESERSVEQLTFSTERKYMATIVESKEFGCKVLYVKGAPEIVMSLSSGVYTKGGVVEEVSQCEAEINAQLLRYQNQAMRTLGFAYQFIDGDDDRAYIKDGKLDGVSLTYMGIVAISDPVREDVPCAIEECLGAGIAIKIVTGDTPATAKEVGRQIGLWGSDDGEEHHITGVAFAAMSDDALMSRVSDIKIMSRARPMDKQRLVQLLQRAGEVVAVTGDGTNDAPALNAAQVGLSMGDGTSVAKEASDITIVDNSFSSISRAVMWGRSLYQNIQRFILFQMTINVVACLIVVAGAFLGTESPLTVTQMLWVNLIMDTLAALALASLPPSRRVMSVPPRKGSDHIITRGMAASILGVGLLFVALMFGLVQYFKHVDIVSLTQFDVAEYFAAYFNFADVANGLSPFELSALFTIFVMLQFWNMFNAKAFASQWGSAFANIGESVGFLATALVILVGQWVIVTFGGAMFNVVPLAGVDWAIIIVSTSVVLIACELLRFVARLFRR